ncbi:MAG: tyrosine-type recombinase/integrase [Acidimicrobiales bacterium]
MLDAGLARSSVRRILASGSAAMTAARRAGEVSGVNPFVDVHLPTVLDPERRFVTVEEARLIEAEMDPRWRLLVPFALDTGLRISELAGLQAGDIIWRDGGCMVRVQRIVTDTAGTVRIGPPKTRAGIRVVPTITRPVSVRLKDHIASRGLAPTDPLYAGERGGVMRPTNWRARVFRPAVLAAGLAGITPHSLRHGAVARWIAAGQSDPYVLSRWLGHSSPVIVYRTYAHLLPQDATAITERMEAEAAMAGGMEDWAMEPEEDG